MRDRIGALQIVFGMLSGRPQVYIGARLRWRDWHGSLPAPAVAFRVFQRALHFFAQHFGEDRAANNAAAGSGDVGSAIAIGEDAMERLLDPISFERKAEG